MAFQAPVCVRCRLVVVAVCFVAAAGLTACNRGSAANGAGGAAGPGGPGGRRGAGPSVEVRTTTVQRMSVQRTVDLAGTLLSPDQAKVSAEAAGVVRQVLVEIGTEVTAGQPLVRARSAGAGAGAGAGRELAAPDLRAAGHARRRRTATTPPPADEQVATVKTAIANLDDAKAAMARAETLRKRGILSPVDLQTAADPAQGGRGGLPVGVRHGAQPEGAAAGPPGGLRAGAEEARRRRGEGAHRRRRSSERFVQVGEYIPRADGGRDHRAGEPAEAPDRRAGTPRGRHPARPGGRVPGGVVRRHACSSGKVAYVSPAVDQTMRTFRSRRWSTTTTAG